MQDHKTLSLFYNCDEKDVLGHRCSAKHFLLLLVEDDADSKTIDPATPNPPPLMTSQNLYISIFPHKPLLDPLPLTHSTSKDLLEIYLSLC